MLKQTKFTGWSIPSITTSQTRSSHMATRRVVSAVRGWLCADTLAQHSTETTCAAVAIIIELASVDGSEPGPSRLAKTQSWKTSIFRPKW